MWTANSLKNQNSSKCKNIYRIKVWFLLYAFLHQGYDIFVSFWWKYSYSTKNKTTIIKQGFLVLKGNGSLPCSELRQCRSPTTSLYFTTDCTSSAVLRGVAFHVRSVSISHTWTLSPEATATLTVHLQLYVRHALSWLLYFLGVCGGGEYVCMKLSKKQRDISGWLCRTCGSLPRKLTCVSLSLS